MLHVLKDKQLQILPIIPACVGIQDNMDKVKLFVYIILLRVLYDILTADPTNKVDN